MVKMNNALIRSLFANRITNLKGRLRFLEQYQPILETNFEQRIQTRIARKKLYHQQSLVHYGIFAGIDEPNIHQTYADEKKRIEQKYYWRRRALIQKEKRQKEQNLDLSKVEEQMVQLEQELKFLLEQLTKKFYPVATTESIQTYQQKKVLYEKDELRMEKESSQKIESFRQRSKARYEKKHARLQKQLESANRILAVRTGGNEALSDSIPKDVILRLDHLTMRFGGLTAVDDLTFDVKKGEIFGLIGPNGAGKTTVFNCITRFYRATSGNVYYRNRLNEPIHLNRYKVHNVIKEGIVRTFQNVELIWELDILDNLLVAAHTLYQSNFYDHLLNTRRFRQEEAVLRQKAMTILEDLELSAYIHAYPLGLPYGILKRVELARTLMVNPKLIILDEPAAGLNDTETVMLSQVIRKIQKEYQCTIFLVEHDMGLVMDICDTVCAISFGKKLAIGTPKEIQGNQVVRDAYLGGE